MITILNELNYYYDNTLTALKTSQFTFYLTGSRFFGTASSISDWDFFTQHGKEVQDFLLKIGFRLLRLNDPKNIGYSWINLVSIYNYQNIHIQLVKDVEEKKKIQEILFCTLALRRIDKIRQKSIWRAMERLAVWYRSR